MGFAHLAFPEERADNKGDGKYRCQAKGKRKGRRIPNAGTIINAAGAKNSSAAVGDKPTGMIQQGCVPASAVEPDESSERRQRSRSQDQSLQTELLLERNVKRSNIIQN